ncbi:MAG: phosphate/phosphite/phosphonate ABC transporter substrate-binding protein [Gammaproteobacteria bacterium]
MIFTRRRPDFLHPPMRLRLFPLLLFVLVTAMPLAARAARLEAPLRVGLTPVFLDDHVNFLRAWKRYLEEHIGQPVEFVQRKSYREINELLLRDEIDFAWVCGFPYVQHWHTFRLVAVPVFQGKPLYRSYLIVPASDHVTRGWRDLRGKVFAFSDPDSNSGYLYPQYHMRQLGIVPPQFFRAFFFAWGHRNVVEAVAAGLAQAGAVDGYVWETLAKQDPGLTKRTRVVARSPLFAFPPIVARNALPRAAVEKFQRTLVHMSDDPQGRRLLRELNLDGFAVEPPALFDSIHQMMLAVPSR